MGSMIYYVLTTLIFFAIYIIYTLGLNLEFGVTGILNFAYITFVAVGAYFAGVTALGPQNHGMSGQYILGWQLPFPIPPLLGGLAAALLGVVVGYIGLRRLRSDYLAIVTVAVGQIVWTAIGNETPLFNGWDGISGVPQPLNSMFNLSSNNYEWVFLVICFAIAFIAWVVAERLVHSPYGRVLRAIREDEDVVAAMGKNVFRYKMSAFLIGSFYAGVGGALTIEYIGAFNPSGWVTMETFIVWAAMLVGGRGNNLGAVLGAFLVPVLFTQVTLFLPPIPNHPLLIDSLRGMAIGLLLILVARFRPEGTLPERKTIFRTKGTHVEEVEGRHAIQG